ncbi:hypothetical protein NBG4_160014 [Candidatus Sulfobium mesophilum]|uniref:Uncharacterized protein n=1 Tax=Candidatus Sulfobium mesophilum TaxID=2016548 RepID=A0A2U3QFG0_9BACT|nr:hypothetical protein NBG4_160014 [Candidatus Sulfobium mesophilum]
MEGFRAFTSCLSRAKEKGIINGTGAWKIGDIKGSKAMPQAYEVGKKYRQGIIHKWLRQLFSISEESSRRKVSGKG